MPNANSEAARVLSWTAETARDNQNTRTGAGRVDNQSAVCDKCDREWARIVGSCDRMTTIRAGARVGYEGIERHKWSVLQDSGRDWALHPPAIQNPG